MHCPPAHGFVTLFGIVPDDIEFSTPVLTGEVRRPSSVERVELLGPTSTVRMEVLTCGFGLSVRDEGADLV